MSKQSTFCEPGTLSPPGPVGRLVRLLFALLCLGFLWTRLLADPLQVVARFPTDDELWPWAFAALYLFAYVVNIGFGRSWGRWPPFVAIMALFAMSCVSRATTGNWFGPPLAWAFLAWMAYTYAHLGLSFLLSAVAATPGCEMRAIPHVLGRLTGRTAREHHCPVGPLNHIDSWEYKRRTNGAGSAPR